MSEFQKNIISIYGIKGEEWLNSLPDLIENISEKWSLKNLKLLTNLSYNYLLEAEQDNRAVILKIGLDKDSIKRKAETLDFFNGKGSVKIYTKDIENGALLLEKLLSQNLESFFENKENESIVIACDILKNLQTCSEKFSNKIKFPLIENWLDTLNKEFNIPFAYLQKARKLSEKLIKTSEKSILLHGDLHHNNIMLRSKNEWVSIDPKGVIGEPAYELGAFIRNPYPQIINNKNIKEIIKNRINLFGEYLNIDTQRILEWSYVQAILSACWMLEDNLDSFPMLSIAKIIDEL